MNLEDLDRLADLHARGVLSDEEFQAARRRLVADQPTGPLDLGPNLPGAASAAEAAPARGWSGLDLPPAPSPPPTSTAAPSSPAENAEPPAVGGGVAMAGGTQSAPPQPGRKAGRGWALLLGALALAGLAAAVTAGFLWWQRSSAMELARSGDAALLAGDYARAAAQYESAQGRWARVAVLPERLAFAQGGLAETRGDQAVADKDYDSAVTQLALAVQRYTAADEGYRTSGQGESVERSSLATRLEAARATEQYARGLLALRDGETTDAVDFLTAAMGIQPRPEIQAALDRARARLAFEEGQRLLAAGDLVGAYERFKAAADLENLPEYAAALGLAADQLARQAQSALERGLDALQRGDYSQAAELLAAIPSAASEAFGAAQGPLAEARTRLGQALGLPTPAPAPGSEVTAPAEVPEVAALYALHYLAAAGACQAAVESAADGEVEWTDGWFGRKFPRFETTLKAPGVLSIAGDSLRIREADGTWRPVSYACDYDTGAGAVVAVTLQ